MSQVCVVSFRDHQGLEHSVEVAAGSLYEAAALAIKAFRSSPLGDHAPGPGTELAVTVRAEIATRRLRVRQLTDWLACAGRSPAEQALKTRLAEELDVR